MELVLAYLSDRDVINGDVFDFSIFHGLVVPVVKDHVFDVFVVQLYELNVNGAEAHFLIIRIALAFLVKRFKLLLNSVFDRQSLW